jgi:MmyB-like transcription regulator ligand binding domain
LPAADLAARPLITAVPFPLAMNRSPVRALQKASTEFAALWERHEVARRFADHKTLIHPELGPIEVDCQVLLTEDQSQALLVLTAPPRTEAYEKLQSLAVLGHQPFAETRHALRASG